MGVLLLIVGLGVLGFGLWNHLKGKRILAAPFKKTGELAKNPVSDDPKGAMSTEGKIIPPAQALLSPCSKQPCLYYEVKVERIYEKTETTQDGTKTTKNTETLDTVKGGAQFALDDGTGAIAVDVTKGADFDTMKEGFKKELNGRSWASNIQFGEFSYDVPPISSGGDSWTIGFKATEKYVPVEGSLFVLGKLEGANIVKPGWRSMLASSKGREGLLGSIQKKKKFSFIGGGVAAVLAIPLMIFGPKADPNAIGASCESALTNTRVKCSAQVTSKSGDEYTWTVTRPAKYDLEVFAPAKKVSFDPQIIVKDEKGEVVAEQEGGVGQNALASVDLTPGTYTVIVKPGDDYMVKGGFSYSMEIRSDAVEALAKADGTNVEPVADLEKDLAKRLTALNELCGDTWCEGSFDYKFTSLACPTPGKCALGFTAKNSDTKKNYVAMVEVTGFTTLVPDDDGEFEVAVGEALGKWEANPRNVAPKAEMTKKETRPAKSVAMVQKPAPKAAPATAKTSAAPSPRPAVKSAPAAAAPSIAPAPVRSSPTPAPAKKSGKNLMD